MTILLWILGLIVGAVALGFIIFGISLIGITVYFYLPSIVGILAGLWIWLSTGHDNIGVAVGIIGIFINRYWDRYTSSGPLGTIDYGNDPMDSKSKIYDKSGNVVGYQDKD